MLLVDASIITAYPTAHTNRRKEGQAAEPTRIRCCNDELTGNPDREN